MNQLTKKNFANGHFELRVDTGDPITAFVKGVEGGLLKAASTEEPLAGFHLRARHASTREIEPLSIEFAMSGARWALKQVESVINNREHQQVSGAIVHADTNMREQYIYQFRDARITECTFPKCDAKSKEFTTIKTKLQPQSIDFTLGRGETITAGPVAKQKLWLCSAFRLTIDGFKASTDHAVSVEPLTVKINAKPLQTGAYMLPQYTSAKIDIGKLSFTVPMAHAGPLLDWYREAIFTEKGTIDGGGRPGLYEHTGSLEFLDASRRKVVYEIEFDGIGIEGCTILKAEANQSSTKMVKFDCYITTMKLKPQGALGFI